MEFEGGRKQIHNVMRLREEGQKKSHLKGMRRRYKLEKKAGITAKGVDKRQEKRMYTNVAEHDLDQRLHPNCEDHGDSRLIYQFFANCKK